MGAFSLIVVINLLNRERRMSEFKEVIGDLVTGGLVTLVTESRIELAPFLLKIVQSRQKQKWMPISFCAVHHTAQFYKNHMVKIGISSSEIEFVDLMRDDNLETQENVVSKVRQACKGKVFICDNILLLLPMLNFNVKTLQKLLIQISELSQLAVVGCTREPLFPEFQKFLNFVRCRSDTCIELSVMSGSTAAVGVDGKLVSKSVVYDCNESNDGLSLETIEKEC